MQPRLEALQRLVTLYGQVEEMHSLELQRVTAAVGQARHAIDEEGIVKASARQEGHKALHTGDQLCRLISETQQEISLRRTDLLERELCERVILKEAAMEHYVASRMRREQMDRLQEDVAQKIEVEERRRAQAVSDDQFLARRRWTDNRDKRVLRE